MWTFSPFTCTISAFKMENRSKTGIIFHLLKGWSFSGFSSDLKSRQAGVRIFLERFIGNTKDSEILRKSDAALISSTARTKPEPF